MATTKTSEDAVLRRFDQERQQVVNTLNRKGLRAKKIPDPEDPANKVLYHRLSDFLDWLESIDMTPRLKERARVEVTLKAIFDEQMSYLPTQYRQKALSLYNKWVAADWNTVPTPEPVPEPVHSHQRRPSRVDTKGIAETVYPPSDHPIWGTDGIMHGIAVKLFARPDGTTGRSKVLDDRFPQKDSKVFGHNGLEVGQWFPSRLSAIWHGAHGASQAGITGREAEGAYSVVVSGGEYEGMDRDNGHTLHYSGSDAHDNTNPNKPGEPSTGTKALRTSAETGRPIRVLRTATGQWRAKPSVGLRYDGLYEVVSTAYPRMREEGCMSSSLSTDYPTN